MHRRADSKRGLGSSGASQAPHVGGEWKGSSRSDANGYGYGYSDSPNATSSRTILGRDASQDFPRAPSAWAQDRTRYDHASGSTHVAGLEQRSAAGAGYFASHSNGAAISDVDLTRPAVRHAEGEWERGGTTPGIHVSDANGVMGDYGMHNAHRHSTSGEQQDQAGGWNAIASKAGPLSPPEPRRGGRTGSYVSGIDRPPTTISFDDDEWASQYDDERRNKDVKAPSSGAAAAFYGSRSQQGVGAGGGGSRLEPSRSIMTHPTMGTRGQGTRTALGMASSSRASRYFGWFPRSLPIQLFLLVTLLESTVDISIEAVLLSRFQSQEGSIVGPGADGRQPALPVFVMVFCLAHVYQSALAVDAVVNRNSILVFGLVLFNIAFFVYSLIQISEIRQVLGTGVVEGSGQTVPVQVLTTAIPVIVGTSAGVLSVLSWYIYRDFGWEVYRNIVGADRDLKRAHMNYQVFVALLMLEGHDAEYWLTVIAVPFSLVILGFAWYCARRELKWGMVVFMSLILCAGAYFTYKLFRIWQGRKGAYLEVYKSLTVFSVLAIALVLATVWSAMMCLRKFNCGLRNAIDRAALERKKSSSGHAGPLYGPNGSNEAQRQNSKSAASYLSRKFSKATTLDNFGAAAATGAAGPDHGKAGMHELNSRSDVQLPMQQMQKTNRLSLD
ncbi:hypothetical protein IE81DRAFT_331351 [Ceraceosorus guamensis]|uniref:Uncharacterized protein n=1 Tax=Ceraceosorus guamensis TaxID=1522189 RepID=A0A316VWH7_9BASI|nr:hypothetical protein IE81DRAFT_331351 [Ceraceosorus guamensis]PWN40793.1 hypothetical protein IE81DRAFT_331351 [Ceraceosorus guamensis]